MRTLLRQQFVPEQVVSFNGLECSKATYGCFAVRKPALEGGDDDILVLLFNDLRGGRKYPERVLALVWILRLTCLEEGA